MKADHLNTLKKILLLPMLIICLFIAGIKKVSAQPPKPPHPITVSLGSAQGIQFGAFSVGGTGTVTVNNAGGRSASGGVTLLNIGTFPISAAIYNITANPGTVLTVSSSGATLTGSGGGSMTLTVGTPNVGSPFIVPASPVPFQIYIGGTLNVTAGSQAGNYSGFYTVNFNYQ